MQGYDSSVISRGSFLPARLPDSTAQPVKPRTRSSRARGRVTLQDVAQSLGVSSMTVSRALRGGANVDPHLLERIRSAAQEMGYVPDPAARALASQKSNQILMLVPMLSNGLFVELIEADPLVRARRRVEPHRAAHEAQLEVSLPGGPGRHLVSPCDLIP